MAYRRKLKTTRKRSRSKSRTRSSKRKRSTSKPRRTTRAASRSKKTMVQFAKRRMPSRSRSVPRRLPRDARPSQRKPRSALPTAAPKVTNSAALTPANMKAVQKAFRPKIPEKEVVKKVGMKLKSQYDTAKTRSKFMSKAIEGTAHVVGQAASIVEPFAEMGSMYQPELAPYLMPLAGLADVTKKRAHLIETTAKAAQGDKDAYKQLTDTNKLRKVMGQRPPQPEVNLLTQGEVDPRYVPLPPSTNHPFGEEID